MQKEYFYLQVTLDRIYVMSTNAPHKLLLIIVSC